MQCEYVIVIWRLRQCPLSILVQWWWLLFLSKGWCFFYLSSAWHFYFLNRERLLIFWSHIFNSHRHQIHTNHQYILQNTYISPNCMFLTVYFSSIVFTFFIIYLLGQNIWGCLTSIHASNKKICIKNSHSLINQPKLAWKNKSMKIKLNLYHWMININIYFISYLIR